MSETEAEKKAWVRMISMQDLDDAGPLPSWYSLRPVTHSKCPSCKQVMEMLIDPGRVNNSPYFYICWTCRSIGHVGVGPVVREKMEEDE